MDVRVGLWKRWVPKNWCFWTVVLEKTLESPLDYKKIQPVHPKGNQSWILFGRTDAESEAPIIWSPDMKNWLFRKGPNAERDWRQEEKGTTEDEMFGWHHWLDGHEFEQALGVGDGQGGLACCSPWTRKESDTTEQLNWWLNWLSIPMAKRRKMLPSISSVELSLDLTFLWALGIGFAVFRPDFSLLRIAWELPDERRKGATWRPQCEASIEFPPQNLPSVNKIILPAIQLYQRAEHQGKPLISRDKRRNE